MLPLNTNKQINFDTCVHNSQLKQFKLFKIINLEMCRLITDDGLKYLSESEIINLRGCHKITDRGLKYLKSVKEINLSGCFNITVDGLDSLSSATYIDVSWTNIKKYKRKNLKIIFEDNIITNTNNNLILANNPNKIDFGPAIHNKNNIYGLHKRDIMIDPEIEKKIPKAYKIPFYLSDINFYVGNEKLSNEKNAQYYLYKRLKQFDKVYDEKYNIQNCDNLLETYKKLLPNPDLLSKYKAIRKLYEINPHMELFLGNIKENKLDVLIGGSTGLYCVYEPADFIPSDLDIYIKNMNISDIQLLEDIIYLSFPIENIVVVRGYLNVTYYVQIKSGQICIIQLNLLQIESWTQVFVTYHADFVCIGYEVLTNKFIYMKGRFENILKKQIHYFTNILNFAYVETLHGTCYKYINRGFDCQEIGLEDSRMVSKNCVISSLICKYYGQSINIGSSHYVGGKADLTYLPHILTSLYGKISNHNDYIMASNSAQLFNKNESFLPIVYLSIYQINKYPLKQKYLDFDFAKSIFGQIHEIKNNNSFIGIKCHCGKYNEFINNYCECISEDNIEDAHCGGGRYDQGPFQYFELKTDLIII